jgi:hypothetical protein
MGTHTARSYSKKIKEQIIKECIETNNYNVFDSGDFDSGDSLLNYTYYIRVN